jgi:hypothetical protein
MSERKYDVIPRNGYSSCAYFGFTKQSPLSKCNVVTYRIQYGRDPASDNAIRRWLKQFLESGSVLHRKGAGRPSTSQEGLFITAFTSLPTGHENPDSNLESPFISVSKSKEFDC